MRFNIYSIIIAVLLISTISSGKIIYVDDNAAGANDGSSWQNAYIYLQDALAGANSSEKPVEIRVAQGIYKPDQGAGQTAGDRAASFHLINNVALSGGFAGINKPDPNERNIEKYKTILSGDLAGDDVDVNDPDELLDEPTRAENSLKIVGGSYTDSNAVLDGFTIKGGNNNIVFIDEDWFQTKSSGLSIFSGKPTIRNCIFLYNSGAPALSNSFSDTLITNCSFCFNYTGISNFHSNSTIQDCTFTKNRGHAIRNNISSPTIYDSKFDKNTNSYGGAIFNFSGSPFFMNCIFTQNKAFYQTGSTIYGNGGVMLNQANSKIVLQNCIFSNNLADENGACIYNLGGGVTLYNCTFASNISKEGRVLAIDSASDSSSFSNCILWDDGNEIWNINDTVITLNYSDIRGGQSSIYDTNGGLIWGNGNINVDPLFANPCYWDPNGTPEDANDDFWIDGDYHLKSQAGRFDPNSQTWIQDDVTSPCIDAGDPNSPIGLEPFPNGGYINMGAYGGTSEASKSYFGKPFCETIVAGDINGDCKVDILDFEILVFHWLEEH